MQDDETNLIELYYISAFRKSHKFVRIEMIPRSRLIETIHTYNADRVKSDVDWIKNCLKWNKSFKEVFEHLAV